MYVIVAVPPKTPVITPVILSILATLGVLLLHVPPMVVSVSVVVVPWHMIKVPVIGVGSALTVMIFVTKQVEEKAYVIVVVPIPTPPTIPVTAPTVPTVGVLLVQVPPGTELVKVIVEPKHTVEGPEIVAGVGVTVTMAVMLQPGPNP